MTNPLDFWEKKHHKYYAEPWVHEPNFLAEEIAECVKPGIELLDLGCGQGQDSIYFAGLGATVTAADFSPFALAQFQDEAAAAGVRQLRIDLSDVPYPLADAAFDVVYAHLSLHYFSEATTQAVFSEVARVLKVGGRLFAAFNSVEDEEFGTGQQLESHFFELEPGDQKRFFDEKQVDQFTSGLFRLDEVAFRKGTRKKDEDRYVHLVATRIEDRQ